MHQSGEPNKPTIWGMVYTTHGNGDIGDGLQLGLRHDLLIHHGSYYIITNEYRPVPPIMSFLGCAGPTNRIRGL